MSTAQTWPYLRADPGRIKTSGWLLSHPDGDRRLDEALGDWDPATPVNLKQTIHADLDGIRTDCRLPPEARLRLTTYWHSNGTRIRGVGARLELNGAELTVPLTLGVDGFNLSGSIGLHSVISLSQALPPRPIIAWRPGTILWQESHTLRLEGGGSRFPMEILDFTKCGWQFPNRAAWMLEWDPEDLELPVLGGMRLYLNSDHPRVKRMLEFPKELDVRIFQGAMQYDVARTLIRGALLNPEFIQRDEPWPTDSVGKTIWLLFRSFTGDSPETLRQMMDNDVARFEARLQHHLGLFQGM